MSQHGQASPVPLADQSDLVALGGSGRGYQQFAGCIAVVIIPLVKILKSFDANPLPRDDARPGSKAVRHHQVAPSPVRERLPRFLENRL
jgi:hypothetical protein